MPDVVNSQTNSTTQLFAGDFPRVLKDITIVSGAGVLGVGQVLGKVTASGKFKAYADGNSDGSQTAKLILAEAVDATSADVKCKAYESGHFNQAALTGFDTAAGVDFEGTAIFIGSIL